MPHELYNKSEFTISLFKFISSHATGPEHVYYILLKSLMKELLQSIEYFSFFILSTLIKDIELYSAYLYSEPEE